MLPSHPSLLRVAGIAMTILACSFSVFGDTPALLRQVPAGGCYCHCAESNLRGGCVKMCDSKKHASRSWSRSCAKRHLNTSGKHVFSRSEEHTSELQSHLNLVCRLLLEKKKKKKVSKFIVLDRHS